MVFSKPVGFSWWMQRESIRSTVIEGAARRAIERVGELEPFRLAGDIELELSFKNYRQAEILSYLSTVERIDSHSIRYVAKDMVEASMFAQFVNNYQPGLSP